MIERNSEKMATERRRGFLGKEVTEMPRGDGTGPYGQGPGSGRGLGRGSGPGRTGGTRPGAGPDGNCVCPSCGATVPHKAGVPCNSVRCPKCGTSMVRE